ncbi:MAG: TonB-dependent receptor [Spongiibacteraceae bacterium]|nr:TonB-dependent receptor [Spongiibacteraceae bacterium]
MIRNSKILTHATCTAVLLLGIANDALAQEKDVSSGSKSVKNVLLEEVLVTSRKRVESYLDVPTSVSALSAESMKAQGIQNVQDLGNSIPNVNFAPGARRGQSFVTVRGIGGTNPRAGGALDASGAAMYVDGHYLPNFIGFGMSALDIQQVEVSRGPQGTLFGKNSTGGAINIVTKKPSDEFEAEVSIRAEEHGTRASKAVFNIPFTDTLYARFGVSNETSDGYAYNRYTQQDWGETDGQAWSAALRFEPNNHLTVDFSYRRDEQDDDNSHGQCRLYRNQEIVDAYPNYTGPSGNVAENAANGIGIWGADQFFVNSIDGITGDGSEGSATYALWQACETDTAAGIDTFSADTQAYLKLKNEYANFAAVWDSDGEVLGLENLSVKLSAGHSRYAMNFLTDSDYTPLPIIALGIAQGRQYEGNVREADSLELQFNATINEQLDLVMGVAHFEDQFRSGAGDCLKVFQENFDAIAEEVVPPWNFQGNPPVNFPGPSFPCNTKGGASFAFLAGGDNGAGPEPNARNFETDNESDAVYAHVNWDITNNLELAVGVRYTEEEKSFQGVEVAAGGRDACLFSTEPNDGLPPSTALCSPNAQGTYELSYLNVHDAGAYNDLEASFSETTTMTSLSYTFNEDMMVYALYSEGFLSGSFNDEFNAEQFPATESFLIYEPEFVKNYELGYKGTLLDGNMTVSASLFKMEFEDKQVTTGLQNEFPFFCPPFNDVCEYTSNAATLDIQGLELKIRASLWEGGAIAFDYSNLDAEYGSYESLGIDPNSGEIVTVDKAGSLIPSYAPEQTVNLTVIHDFFLDGGASISAQVGAYWQTEYNFAAGTSGAEHPGNDVCEQSSYTTFRARASFTPADDNFEVAIFGKNLTDKRTLTSCDQFRQGTYSVTYSEPRRLGVEFTYRFGS